MAGCLDTLPEGIGSILSPEKSGDWSRRTAYIILAAVRFGVWFLLPRAYRGWGVDELLSVLFPGYLGADRVIYSHLCNDLDH